MTCTLNCQTPPPGADPIFAIDRAKKIKVNAQQREVFDITWNQTTSDTQIGVKQVVWSCAPPVSEPERSANRQTLAIPKRRNIMATITADATTLSELKQTAVTNLVAVANGTTTLGQATKEAALILCNEELNFITSAINALMKSNKYPEQAT
jgi:hypothetical protein